MFVKHNLSKFEDLSGYKFKDTKLLSEALTHKSYSIDQNKNVKHNERLEFLGDAVLNILITEELIKRFPNENEGVLSKKRASLVNQTKLYEIARRFEPESFIMFGPGEIKQGSHLNQRIQASFLEAYIGALYLDAGFIKTKEIVSAFYSNEDYDISIREEVFLQDYKSRLQEWAQRNKMGSPDYRLVLATGPSHDPKFLVSVWVQEIEIARAESGSKKNAEQKAAQLALGILIEKNRE